VTTTCPWIFGRGRRSIELKGFRRCFLYRPPPSGREAPPLASPPVPYDELVFDESIVCNSVVTANGFRRALKSSGETKTNTKYSLQ